MNNEELITDARNYAFGLQAGVHDRHTGAELIEKLCDALEAAETYQEYYRARAWIEGVNFHPCTIPTHRVQ